MTGCEETIPCSSRLAAPRVFVVAIGDAVSLRVA
jgi:hypothetical protein